MCPLDGDHRFWLNRPVRASILLLIIAGMPCLAGEPVPFPTDPSQSLERTCFQTGQGWSAAGNLRSDVAIVYGVDPKLPERIQTWRDRGYRIHVMTGVSWGNYQDYLYGRFDGINHEDEAQTERNGKKISHGGDVYYMCPGTNFGKFLSVGVQRALDSGAEAIHLEEPEFWVRGGYSEGFKREWQGYYGEAWQPPHSSVDAQWRASKLKYFLYRRALQQVFDHVQEYNRRTGRKVRCYVPTHSLLNYAHWRIVSPESSLARLNGCDGYIAQVWTGTSRTANQYRGQLRERTFETAFLEYGAMQNLVRATGRTVWYLNDPVEDDPNHDWDDYRGNWESTLVASLLQPEVWQYEVAPWPERVFAGKHRRHRGDSAREPIPPEYASELQAVFTALNDMKQEKVTWDCGTRGVGLVVSDSLMFERGEPEPSDAHLGNVYGLALPLVKRGVPVAPVQLESVTLPASLAGYRLLLLSYDGQKPLTPEVNSALAQWVKTGGALVVVDKDADPYNRVREWWNTGAPAYETPRAHLFEQLGIREADFTEARRVVNAGKGAVLWFKERPASLASQPDGDARLMAVVQAAAAARGIKWSEANHLLLRRGPYIAAAGLDESVDAPAPRLGGKFINLFDPSLRVTNAVVLAPGSRFLLVDLAAAGKGQPRVLASSCKTLPRGTAKGTLDLAVEGVGNTPAVVLVRCPSKPPAAVTLEGEAISTTEYSAADELLWIRFTNESRPRQLFLKW